MKVTDIRKLKDYTNNIEVLRRIFIYDVNPDLVINKYDELKSKGKNAISQSNIDKIVLEYCVDQKHNTFAKLLESRTFIDLLKTMSSAELDEYFYFAAYLDLRAYEKTIDIITNDEYISYYKDNYLELCKLLQTLNSELFLIVLRMVINKFSFLAIQEIEKRYSRLHNQRHYSTIAQQVSLLDNLINSKDKEKDLSEKDCQDLLTALDKVNYENYEIIQQATNISNWLNIIAFADLYDLIKHVIKEKYNNYSIIFMKTALKNRTKEELREMLNYINSYPKAAYFFTDEYWLTELTWEEQKEIFGSNNIADENSKEVLEDIKKRLESPEECEVSLVRIYHKLTEILKEKDNLYNNSDLTIDEFIYSCRDINSFLKQIEKTYTEEDEVILKSSLKKLTRKEQ